MLDPRLLKTKKDVSEDGESHEESWLFSVDPNTSDRDVFDACYAVLEDMGEYPAGYSGNLWFVDRATFRRLCSDRVAVHQTGGCDV